MVEEKRPKQRRGFACMDKARLKEVSAHGGTRAHQLGRAHTWDSKAARKAGAKGGRTKAQRAEG